MYIKRYIEQKGLPKESLQLVEKFCFLGKALSYRAFPLSKQSTGLF